VRVIKDVATTGAYGGNFSGAVDFAMLREAPAPGAADEQGVDVALVHFHDGAATHWHAHPGGQLLWVADGTGRVGIEGAGEIILEPGTVVESPAGEWHYHGAAEGHDAQLVAFTWGTTQWSDRPAPGGQANGEREGSGS
jgi:quercetin dioxygenase-like cupin family protein